MGRYSEGGGRIITIDPIHTTWNTIRSAYEHGYPSPQDSLRMAQRYAACVATQAKEQLAFMHVPYTLFEGRSALGRIYAVEGIGFRLGPEFRQYIHTVLFPHNLPMQRDWVAISGGQRTAVITLNSPETVEYLEPLLASRDTPKGRRQLLQFLHEEGVSLAHSDGEKVFTTPQGHYVYPDNMFSALARHIEPFVVPERPRRQISQHAHLIRRGNLVLV